MDQLTGLGFGCFSKLKFPFFSQFLGIFDEFSKWKIVKKRAKTYPKPKSVTRSITIVTYYLKKISSKRNHWRWIFWQMIVMHEIFDFFARFGSHHLVDHGSHVWIQLVEFNFLHGSTIKVIHSCFVEFNQRVFILYN